MIQESDKRSREEVQKEKLDEQAATLWPKIEPVPYHNETQLYENVHQALYGFVDLPDDRYYHAATSGIMLSHRIHQFETTPYYHFWGQKRSGKTRLQSLFKKPVSYTHLTLPTICSV